MATHSSGGMKPPDPNRQWTKNNGQTMPSWIDQNKEFGQAHFLVMQAENGHSLPKNPFIIGKSIQQAAGEIERGHTEANRTRYVLKVRKADQVKKLLAITKLLDDTPVTVNYHPTLNFSKCVVSCWEAIDMKEDELMECLGPQGVTHVYRMTSKKDGKITPLPTLIVTVLGTVAPEYLKFGPLVVKTRTYVPEPMMCYNCWQIGHTKRRCTKKPVCGKCGGDHPLDVNVHCKQPEFCVRCGKHDHPSFKRTCKIYQEEKEVQRLHAVKGLSFDEARKVVKDGNTTYAGAVQQRITRSDTENELIKEMAQKNREIENLKKQVEVLTKKLDSLMCCVSVTEVETESEVEEPKQKSEKQLTKDEDNAIVINKTRGSKKHKRHLTIDNAHQPSKKGPKGERSTLTTGVISKQPGETQTAFNGNPQQISAMEIDNALENNKLQTTSNVSSLPVLSNTRNKNVS